MGGVAERWSQGRGRKLEDMFIEGEVQEVRKLMSLRKRGKDKEMETGLGRSPRGEGPQRRGEADPKKRAWLRGTETAKEKSLAKAEGSQPRTVPEGRYRKGTSGVIGWNGLVGTGRSVAEVSFSAYVIDYSLW